MSATRRTRLAIALGGSILAVGTSLAWRPADDPSARPSTALGSTECCIHASLLVAWQLGCRTTLAEMRERFGPAKAEGGHQLAGIRSALEELGLFVVPIQGMTLPGVADVVSRPGVVAVLALRQGGGSHVAACLGVARDGGLVVCDGTRSLPIAVPPGTTLPGFEEGGGTVFVTSAEWKLLGRIDAMRQVGLPPIPRIQVEPRALVVKPENVGEGQGLSFRIVNAGHGLLVIKEVRSGCTPCMTVKLSNSVVRPGGEAMLAVTVDTAQWGDGQQTKSVYLVSNDPDEPALALKVTGELNAVHGTQAVFIHPRRLTGLTVTPNDLTSQTVGVLVSGPPGGRIDSLAVSSTLKALSWSLVTAPGGMESRQAVRLSFSAFPPGDFVGDIVVRGQVSAQQFSFVVPVSGRVLEGTTISPDQLTFLSGVEATADIIVAGHERVPTRVAAACFEGPVPAEFVLEQREGEAQGITRIAVWSHGARASRDVSFAVIVSLQRGDSDKLDRRRVIVRLVGQ